VEFQPSVNEMKSFTFILKLYFCCFLTIMQTESILTNSMTIISSHTV